VGITGEGLVEKGGPQPSGPFRGGLEGLAVARRNGKTVWTKKAEEKGGRTTAAAVEERELEILSKALSGGKVGRFPVIPDKNDGWKRRRSEITGR